MSGAIPLLHLYAFMTWAGKLELPSKTLDVVKVCIFFNIYYDQLFCMHVFELHLSKRI